MCYFLLILVRELSVGSRIRAGKQNGVARKRAKGEGIAARLEVPRSEATRRREPGVNTSIFGTLTLFAKRTSPPRTAGFGGA
jgi:hypothetical protein